MNNVLFVIPRQFTGPLIDQDADRSLLDEVMIFNGISGFVFAPWTSSANSGISASIDDAAFTPRRNRSATAAARRVAVAAPPLG